MSLYRAEYKNNNYGGIYTRSGAIAALSLHMQAPHIAKGSVAAIEMTAEKLQYTLLRHVSQRVGLIVVPGCLSGCLSVIPRPTAYHD